MGEDAAEAQYTWWSDVEPIVRERCQLCHAAPPQFDASYMATSKMFSGGGGLLSMPSDYLRFAQMLNNGGELDVHRLLKKSTIDLMMQNHVAASITPKPSFSRRRNASSTDLCSTTVVITCKARSEPSR